MSRMMSGTPLLKGDNTVPGTKIHKEVLEVLPQIEAACRKMGLDYPPIIVEFVSYDEMAELASYGGFPSRYPHWRFGMEYEGLSRGYEENQFRISEMVTNTVPAVIYCMDSNTLVDNVDVIAHAIGHADFFKNNVFFKPTNKGMLNKMANHGSRIRNYMARWGYEQVTEFIDHVLRIDTLTDPAKAWKKRKIENRAIRDERHYKHPQRLKAGRDYMEEWVNTKEFIRDQQEQIRKEEAAQFLDLFDGPTKDIFGFIKDNAPLKPWQQDIVSMLYDEAVYFGVQRSTKTGNEGLASYVDHHIMCREGLAALGQPGEDCGIWHYAEHKMRVLGGKYSQNPYKLGFELLMDIEDRWNKGRFGTEWEECDDMHEKRNWDRKLGLGMEKVLEVRKYHNDFTLISEFFTPEFCDKHQFYEWKRFPNGEYKIVDRDFKRVKKKLLQKHLNGGLPDIRLTDPNHLGKGWFFMEHQWDGSPLYDPYARETIMSLHRLWKNVVVLSTKNRDGNEFLYICDGPSVANDVHVMSKEDYESEFIK